MVRVHRYRLSELPHMVSVMYIVALNATSHSASAGRRNRFLLSVYSRNCIIIVIITVFVAVMF